ncbi:MAG: tetratricopeptide repeat protein [Planctomycetota bacterium]|nr:tetratricopeptide repeat protein [Planctomycetota bacterium]
MKTERRHELQQNDLAVYLNKINKSIEPHSRLIAVAVGALFVAFIGYALYSSQQTGNRSVATLQLIEGVGGQDAEVLANINDSFPDTIAGKWAKLYQGQGYLSDGLQALYTDREEAEGLFKDAQSAFQRVLETGKDRLLVSRANLGIAQSKEAVGDLQGAKEAYEAVKAANESEAMIELANSRIEALSKPETEEFMAWFADQDFSPTMPSAADPSLPPSTTIPGLPDFDLPNLESAMEGASEERDLEGGISLPEVVDETLSAEDSSEEGSKEESLQLPTSGATEDPAPATEDPAPATEDPAPATEDPAPATEDPAPATEAPAPATEAPAPANENDEVSSE